METVKIDPDEIQVGQQLPWPVYDQKGRLLLQKGERIVSQSQLNALQERGLYREVAGVRERGAGSQQCADASPFELVAEYAHRYQVLAKAVFEGKEGTAGRLARLVEDIRGLKAVDADAVIGGLHLFRFTHGTFRHDLRQVYMAFLADFLADQAGIAETQRGSVTGAALTANVAMGDQADALQMQRESLTRDQQQLIARHPEQAADLLRRVGVDDPLWLRMVEEHHERPDGDGYPKKRSAAQIAFETRIVTLAEAYTAMVLPRGGRNILAPQEALREVLLVRGKQFDEALVALLVRSFGIYPPGVLVKLSNGETAVVVRRGQDPKLPQLCSVINARGQPILRPVRRDPSAEQSRLVGFAGEVKQFPVNVLVLWGYA